MPTDAACVYWDACVVLSYINADSERLPVLEELLAEARRGEARIVTSTLSVVEVAFAAEEQRRQAPDPATEAQIDALWTPGSVIILAEFHFGIARRARALMREAMARGWSLKPPDAIHLATALQHSADRYHTYDDRLSKYAGISGLIIAEPHAVQPQLPEA